MSNPAAACRVRTSPAESAGSRRKERRASANRLPARDPLGLGVAGEAFHGAHRYPHRDADRFLHPFDGGQLIFVGLVTFFGFRLFRAVIRRRFQSLQQVFQPGDRARDASHQIIRVRAGLRLLQQEQEQCVVPVLGILQDTAGGVDPPFIRSGPNGSAMR